MAMRGRVGNTTSTALRSYNRIINNVTEQCDKYRELSSTLGRNMKMAVVYSNKDGYIKYIGDQLFVNTIADKCEEKLLDSSAWEESTLPKIVERVVLPQLPAPLSKLNAKDMQHIIPNVMRNLRGGGYVKWGKVDHKPVWWPEGVVFANVKQRPEQQNPGPEETTDKDSMDNDSTASSNSADDIDLSDPTTSDESYIQPKTSTPHAQPRSTPLAHPSPTPTEPPQFSTPKTASLLMPLVRSGKRNWVDMENDPAVIDFLNNSPKPKKRRIKPRDIFTPSKYIEKLIMQMTDHMVADGYKDAGYEYVCIDDCWLAPERDNNSRLQPDPVRFPSGMKKLADYVHSKGLKIGIYEDFGRKTCAGFPGSEFYLKTDAQTFADWGIDLLKFDTCNVDAHDSPYGYPAMAMYLNQTGRPILFSCEWPYGELQQKLPSNYSLVRKACNIWRNFWDISDNWNSIQGYITFYGKNNELFQKYTGPGGFFDPDMLTIGNFGLSRYQSQVQMAMWAMWSAPLIMSNDLRNIGDFEKDLLLNKNLIAVNQDPLGTMATKLFEFNKLEIWVKPILPMSSLAVVLLNTATFGSGTPISLQADSVSMTDTRGYNVIEAFTGQSKGLIHPTDQLNLFVTPTSVYMMICKINA